MALTDSLDKIYEIYVKGVASHPFTYKGKLLTPKPLQLSPLLVRGFTCPPNCGGCCPRFSLDYLPDDKMPYLIVDREVEINGKPRVIFSDTQQDHKNHHCRNLQDDDFCGIHERNPFSRDFELIRFIEYQDESRPTILTQKLFGRGWAMLRVDDERGALCTMTPPSPASVKDVIRKMELLQKWCQHAYVDNRIDEIIKWLDGGAHEKVVLKLEVATWQEKRDTEPTK